MPAPVTYSQRTGPFRPPSTPDPALQAARASLEALLAEVTALAHQLRKSRVMVPQQDNSLQAGWSILQILGRLGPQTVPDIARTRGLSRQNIQIQVNRLESHGYVAIAPNPAHKRSSLVELTERGRDLLATVLDREATSLESLLPHVSQSRLVPATRLLRRLAELLAGTESPRAETADAQPLTEPTTMPRKPARGRKAASAAAGSPAAPTLSQPDEGEFPVNLL